MGRHLLLLNKEEVFQQMLCCDKSTCENQYTIREPIEHLLCRGQAKTTGQQANRKNRGLSICRSKNREGRRTFVDLQALLSLVSNKNQYQRRGNCLVVRAEKVRRYADILFLECDLVMRMSYICICVSL